MGVNTVENDGIDREKGEGHTTEGYAPVSERYSATKDSFTIGEVVERLRPEFPTLSVSKIRYLERRRLINLSRTRGGYRLFSSQDIELLRYILTLQDKEYLPLKVIKKRIEGGGGFTAGDSAGDLSRVLEERTYTREELADTLETEIRFVEELISVGVIGRSGELRSATPRSRAWPWRWRSTRSNPATCAASWPPWTARPPSSSRSSTRICAAVMTAAWARL
jgi:DNA-binding transcriptional MerR regulator